MARSSNFKGHIVLQGGEYRNFTLWLKPCIWGVQRCIQVFKFGGPLDPFLKNLGVHCKILGVQLINIQELIFDLYCLLIAAPVPFQISKLYKNKVLSLPTNMYLK